MEFKHFFNAYDTTGIQHTGFLQSMDFSALTGSVTFLNELTMAMMDAYLYTELSESLVMRQWGHYLQYNKENERLSLYIFDDSFGETHVDLAHCYITIRSNRIGPVEFQGAIIGIGDADRNVTILQPCNIILHWRVFGSLHVKDRRIITQRCQTRLRKRQQHICNLTFLHLSTEVRYCIRNPI